MWLITEGQTVSPDHHSWAAEQCLNSRFEVCITVNNLVWLGLEFSVLFSVAATDINLIRPIISTSAPPRHMRFYYVWDFQNKTHTRRGDWWSVSAYQLFHDLLIEYILSSLEIFKVWGQQHISYVVKNQWVDVKMSVPLGPFSAAFSVLFKSAFITLTCVIILHI